MDCFEISPILGSDDCDATPEPSSWHPTGAKAFSGAGRNIFCNRKMIFCAFSMNNFKNLKHLFCAFSMIIFKQLKPAPGAHFRAHGFPVPVAETRHPSAREANPEGLGGIRS